MTLLPLPSSPGGEHLDAGYAAEIVRQIERRFGPLASFASDVVWLGHDLFTGAAAVEAATITRSRSALLNHMSYAAYKGFQSGSQAARVKKVIKEAGQR